MVHLESFVKTSDEWCNRIINISVIGYKIPKKMCVLVYKMYNENILSKSVNTATKYTQYVLKDRKVRLKNSLWYA